LLYFVFFFFSSRRRHTRSYGDWSSDVCSSDLGSIRKAIRLSAVGAVICVCRNPIVAASPPDQVPNSSSSAVAPRFVVLTQPVKVKIAYGETVLPAGMKLPVVSSDATSIRVKYMGESQTIPSAAARFEDSESPDAVPSEIPPI